MLDQLHGTKRHHQHRNQQVGKGKRHNEIVGFYFPVSEKVVGEGCEEEGGESQGRIRESGRKEQKEVEKERRNHTLNIIHESQFSLLHHGQGDSLCSALMPQSPFLPLSSALLA